MCFSAEASLAAGVIVGGIAVDGLRHVRRKAEYAVAALPVLLAAHQLVEAVVWWSLQGDVAHSVGRAAAWLYLAFAFGVVPILVPWAVAAIEPEANRRNLHRFTALGTVVAAVLMYALLRGPIVTRIEGRHIVYEVDLWHGGALVALYVLVTCAPLLLSAWPHVRWFGVANLVAAVTLAWFSRSSLISLWCLWAAVTSVVIVSHLRLSARPPAATVRPARPA